MKFRKDINALRAWAVIAVVLFHFGVPPFDGGFIGVDVFFVISGFLMTGILYRSLYERGDKPSLKFFLKFYLARSIRIIPVLLVLCALLLAAGWFFMPSSAYEQLGKYSASASAFVSNIVFWRESSYFHTVSHYNLLLHTWSLSVEWQFYLILPLVVVGVWWFFQSKKTLIGLYILGFATSLALSIYCINQYTSAAFYLLPTRAWELLAGGLIFLCFGQSTPSKLVAKSAGMLGFLMIAISMIYCTSSGWPGYKALLPVIGTCLILFAAEDGSWWSLGGVGQKLGKWSYSIYLWHWPIVFGLLVLGLSSSIFAVTLAIALSVLLGAFSYRFIELTSQSWLKSVRPRVSALIILSAILVVIFASGWLVFKDGYPDRRVNRSGVDLIFAEKNNHNPRRSECHLGTDQKVPECTYGGDKLGLIVLGDSHAQSLIRTAQSAMNKPDQHVLDWTSSGCRTIFGIKTRSPNGLCSTFLDMAYEKQKTYPSDVPLLVVNRISNVFHGRPEDDDPYSTDYLSDKISGTTEFNQEIQSGMVNTLCQFAANRKTFVVLPIPEMLEDVPQTLGWSTVIKGEPGEVSIPRSDYDQRHQLAREAYQQASEQCGVTLLDPVPYLCDEQKCYGSKDGMPLYFDDDHLSERGAALLMPMLQSIFTDDLDTTVKETVSN